MSDVYVPHPRKPWPNGTIRFRISESLAPMAKSILDAIAIWRNGTDLRFVRCIEPLASSDCAVEFRPGTRASSEVGCRVFLQHVTLPAESTRYTILHEIGHLIGLWHQHQREDRDEHIRVAFDNLRGEVRGEYLPRIPSGEFVGAYDYASVMHYPPYWGAIDATRPVYERLRPTPAGVSVEHLKSGVQMPSAGDFAAVRALYGL
jgi:hypothetical protein